MKNKKREAMMIAAATAALLSMGITANAEDKVLNFGCAMYTDGVVNSAMDENAGGNAMRYRNCGKPYSNLMTIWK